MPESPAELRTIGPFRIIRCLGEGGKGRVYEAEQSAPVRRTVAIKVMRASATDANDALRFTAEQQALALMDHPGIAKVFDAGTTDDGQQWFAMELIDGPPLLEFADARKLNIMARVQLFVRVCRAVQHAHQKGIIHRDLKPSNVLVSIDEGIGQPKVIDFGIAKAVDVPLTDQTLLTQFGTVIGTPAYMSPEQSDGTVFAIDTRADVYSLGVMLYELVAGCLPVDPRVAGYPAFIAYLKNPDEAAPMPDKRFAQLPAAQQQDIARSRNTEVTRLPTQLGGDLRWIIMSALDKDPNRRYQSAGAFAADLDQLIAGDVVSAAPPGAAYRLRKFMARNRLAVAAAAMVVLALAGGTIAATIGMLRAEREAAIASSISAFLENVFAEASPFSRSDEDVTARQLLDIAAANIESELVDQPLVQGQLMQSIGASYRGLGLFDSATPLLEKALVLLQAGGATPEQIADAEYELGYHLVFVSQFERSRELLQSAIDYYRAEVGHADDRLGIAIGDLAFSSLRAGHAIPATFAMLDQEIGPAVAAHGRENQAVVQLLFMRCWSLRSLGRTGESLAACREAQAAAQATYIGDAPTLGHVTLAVGHSLRALGRFDEALEVYEEVLAINRRLYGTDHPEIAYTHIASADAHLQRGRHELALEHAEAAVRMMALVHGETSTEYTGALISLALVLVDLRRFEEAEALIAEGIAVDGAAVGTDSVRVAHRRSVLAVSYLRAGRFAQAEQVAAQALETLQRRESAVDDQVWAMMTIGQSAHRLGRHETAELHLRNAYRVLAPHAENRPAPFAEAAFLLASLLLDLDDYAEACPLATAAAERMTTIYGLQSWRPAAADVLVGRCLYHDGQAEAGLVYLHAALDRLASIVPPENIYLLAASEQAAKLR